MQPGDTLSKLEARQKELERDISASTGAGKKANLRLSKPALQKAHEDLLEVVFRIDCLKRAAAGQVVTRKGYGPEKSKAEDVVEIALYYATDRQPTGSTDPAGMYATESDSKLHYGRAVVSIPLTHSVGNIELPSLWKLERNADPKKHFVLKSVAQLPTDAALNDMAQQVNSIASKALLVFVHGYNTSFSDAALRTAQLSHDLKFQGLSLFYSWPSAGLLRGYWQDEEAARLSERAFEQMLDDLAKLPFSDIYVVAHSMGNRIVGHALQSRSTQGKPMRQLRELLLAAPDINAKIFRSVIAPRLAAMSGTRTTIYTSSSDMALVASKVVHRFERVGESNGGIFTYPGLDTVDASSASVLSRGYGHSYLMDSLVVLKDMASIIAERASAKERGLGEVKALPTSYWRLQ